MTIAGKKAHSGRIDRVGEKFGRLTIIGFAGAGKHHVGIWWCLCDCGKVVKVRYNNLYSGSIKSCGCLKSEKTAARSTKHGLSGGHGNYTRLYRIWLNMRRRCLNKNAKDYIHYGGRGISFCKEWDNYAVFYAWAIMSGYQEHLSLERRNNNHGYSPSNCKWATKTQQARNTRKSVKIFYNGSLKSTAEWADVTGIKSSTIRKRISLGWTVEKALTTPIKKEEKQSCQKNKKTSQKDRPTGLRKS